MLPVVSTSSIQPLPLSPSCWCVCWVHWKWDMWVSNGVNGEGSEGAGEARQKEHGEAAASKVNQRRRVCKTGVGRGNRPPNTLWLRPSRPDQGAAGGCVALSPKASLHLEGEDDSAHMGCHPLIDKTAASCIAGNKRRAGGLAKGGCLPVGLTSMWKEGGLNTN